MLRIDTLLYIKKTPLKPKIKGVYGPRTPWTVNPNLGAKVTLVPSQALETSLDSFLYMFWT